MSHERPAEEDLRAELFQAVVDRGPNEYTEDFVGRLLALPALRRLVGQEAEAEQRGYERGRRDFQFNPSGDNHHNAALCPYCSPSSEAGT